MNVRCESCETVYRVDPDRLPVRGVRARCTVCSRVISIEGQSFASAPASRAFAPGTQGRVANALGDAFIPPPEETTAPGPGVQERTKEPPAQAPIAYEQPVQAAPPTVEAESDRAEEEAVAEEVEGQVEKPAEPVLRAPVREPGPPPPAARVPKPESGPVTEPEPAMPSVQEQERKEQPESISADKPAEQPTVVRRSPPEPPHRAEPVPEKAPVRPPWEEVAAQTAPPPPAPPSRGKAVAPKPTSPTAVEQAAKAPKPFAGAGQGRHAATPPSPARPDGRAGRQRLSRPFSVPGSMGAGPTAGAPSQPRGEPARPAAPVFTPTPGRPVQPAPVQAPPPQPTAAAPPVSEKPAAPPPAAPTQAPAVREPTGRPVNPFLSRDPRQKARRLARALISDMIVYQPEKRQRAMRDGTLKEAFDEEIKKSWQEFVEQVGAEIAESTTHFNDALNDILAGGQKVF